MENTVTFEKIIFDLIFGRTKTVRLYFRDKDTCIKFRDLVFNKYCKLGYLICYDTTYHKYVLNISTIGTITYPNATCYNHVSDSIFKSKYSDTDN